MSEQLIGSAQLLDVACNAVNTNNAYGEPVPFGLVIGAAHGLEHALLATGSDTIPLDEAIISVYNYINWFSRN